MNPISLLTKGRTFQDMADRHGEYKMLENSGLPKSMPPRKKAAPAVSHPVPQIAPAREIAPVHEVAQTPEVAETTLFDKPAPTAPAKDPLVVVPTVIAPAIDPITPVQSAAPNPFAAVPKKTEKLSFRILYRKAALFCKRLVQRFIFGRKGRPIHEKTVQTELALDKVTVLKNDLNEDDLEVVLVQRKVGTPSPLARLSKMEMTGDAWFRLTAPFRKKHGDSATGSKAETHASPESTARV
jgi:hypothetical protein